MKDLFLRNIGYFHSTGFRSFSCNITTHFNPRRCFIQAFLLYENKFPEKINCNAEDRVFATAKVTAENATSEVAKSSAETMTSKLAIPRDKKS